MNTPAAATGPSLLLPPPPPAAAGETAQDELRQALGRITGSDGVSEAAIREAVEAAGGVLLFQMELAGSDTDRRVAAAAFGEGEAREIAIIELRRGAEEASVTPAQDSALPIAAIASAYAGLADCWKKAA